MTKTSKRNNNAVNAAAKRAERAAAHAAVQARHAARKAAITQFEAAWEAWYEGGQIGPEPLNPKYRDFTLFPEMRPLPA